MILDKISDQEAKKYGENAYKEHGDKAECPFPIGNDKRMYWYEGFYEVRTNHRVGHILNKMSSNEA